MVKRITLKDVQDCHFKPEPHTVSLVDDGVWYGYIVDDKIVSVICVMDKRGGKYLSESYTDPAYRRHGYFEALLRYVCVVYSDSILIANCLKASRDIYARCGFENVSVRYFKYGTQWRMKKGGGYGRNT